MDKIQELKDQITQMIDESASKADVDTKFNELWQAMDNRDKDTPDYEKMKSDFETMLETKFSELEEKQRKASYEPEEKKDFKCFGDFLAKAKNKAEEVKALAEGAGETGGYLVPEEYREEILRIGVENSVVRNQNARVIPMNTPTLKIPALNQSSNENHLYGGVVAYWTGEGEEKTASEPKFKKIQLDVKKLIGLVVSSDELTDDAITSMGGLLQQMFGETLAFYEDEAFLQGNGVGKPLGVVDAPATVEVTRAATNDVQTGDLINMMVRFLRRGGSPVWVMNHEVWEKILKLQDGNNNYIFFPGMSGNITGGVPMSLYGYPIIITEKLPQLGTSGDIILADFRYYLIGDRQRLTVDESMHHKFAEDETTWRFVQRVDGQPWIDSAVTPRSGGDSLSPFVKLNTDT